LKNKHTRLLEIFTSRRRELLTIEVTRLETRWALDARLSMNGMEWYAT
jgi:hypothetical protein